jgi:chromosome segregation ATPase
MNEDVVTTAENFLHLRNKLGQEAINTNIRIKLIGGLNEEDVKKHISGLEKKYQQMEQELRSKVDLLLSARNKLQKELEICKNVNFEEKKILLESLEKAKNDLSASLEECKNKDLILQSLDGQNNPDTAQFLNRIQQMAEEGEELKKNLSDARLEIEHLKENIARIEAKKESSFNDVQDYENEKAFQDFEQQIEFEKLRNEQQSKELALSQQKIISLEATITKNMAEIVAQRRLYEKAEQELKLGKAQVSGGEITELKDEIFSIYKKLNTITEDQVQINDKLQQQFEEEQLRANRAENNLARLSKWVSEFNEKLCTEQDLLETQFRLFMEKQNQLKSDINSNLLNFQDMPRTNM